MKISTKGRYGLRAMIDLAANSDEGYVSLNSIAKRQDLSLNYLEHAFSALKKSGLVLGMSGSYGGYKLAKDAKEITLKMVLEVLEGDLSIVEKSQKETLFSLCAQTLLWSKINRDIDVLLSNMTLADLAYNGCKSF